MATIQMKTSKKPRIGATIFIPRATKMIRIVPIVTSQIRAKKMNNGTMTREKTSGPISGTMPSIDHS